MDEKLFEQDRAKVGEFLSLAESGSLQAGLTREQKERINQYVVEQRNAYVNDAMLLRSGRFSKSSPAYIEAIQGMNKVKDNLSNLALQQKAYTENQNQFLEDFESDKISKANYLPDVSFGLADIYTGKAKIDIDSQGNMLFDYGQGPKLYNQIADYALKSHDIANTISKKADEIYNSKYRLDEYGLQTKINSIKNLLDNSNRRELASLIKDGLIPGIEKIEVPQDYYKKDNVPQLKEFILNTLNTAFNDMNNKLPSRYNTSTQSNQSKQSKQSDANIPDADKLYTQTGLDERSREAIYNQVKNLSEGDSTVRFKASFTDDVSPTKIGKRIAGATNYEIKKEGGELYMVISDAKGNPKSVKPITDYELRKQLGLLGSSDLVKRPLENIGSKYNTFSYTIPTTDNQ